MGICVAFHGNMDVGHQHRPWMVGSWTKIWSLAAAQTRHHPTLVISRPGPPPSASSLPPSILSVLPFHNELVILPLFLSHFSTIHFLIIMAARPVAVFSHRLSGLRLAHGGAWEFHLCCQKLLLVFSFFAVCILLLV